MNRNWKVGYGGKALLQGAIIAERGHTDYDQPPAWELGLYGKRKGQDISGSCGWG